ncbi:hypothetical protein [Trichloromonas sp.]|uniref:hypothetical protein n=1 Tax=Trichloromonas sp. TaxID=3069249 RepID=UPI002A43730C|nr:hypothetical protein [Trichloromonas sp.]
MGNILLSRRLLVLLCFLLLWPWGVAAEKGGRIVTLWPLLDYRSSVETDYQVTHLLGPLIKLEKKGTEAEFALRPFFYRAAEGPVESFSELLYPLLTTSRSDAETNWRGLQFLNYRRAPQAEEQASSLTLFPFLFSRRGDTEKPDYFAFFPFGGTLLERFGRDEIHFTLFPLHARTKKDETSTEHWLWPFFSRIHGPDESGFDFWPLWGGSRKEGVYRKSYLLWPIFFSEDLHLDGDNPRRIRAAFPFYLEDESPEFTRHTVLWPFFGHVVDRRRNYEQWDLPMPLVRITRGKDRQGLRLLPFFADERSGDRRKRWFLWPLYKIEENRSDNYRFRRDQVLFFLYSQQQKTLAAESIPDRRRIDLWPLVSFRRANNVNHLHLLSLLEPIFPEQPGIERNWAPLWRLYQRKWDDSGNSVSSFLWNLYWHERRGEDRAMELFPLFRYTRQSDSGTDLSLLKGLFRYRHAGDGKRINLFYLPWPLAWGDRMEAGVGI